MNNATQVPIWIPLLVALIGLLGVLATQALSIWQGAQTAKRQEVARMADRAHEDRTWQREQRLSVYAEFVTHVINNERGRASINRRSITPGDPVGSTEAMERLERAAKEMQVLSGPIEILGSASIVKIALNIQIKTVNFYTLFMSVVLQKMEVSDWESESVSLDKELINLRYELLDAIRSDMTILQD